MNKYKDKKAKVKSFGMSYQHPFSDSLKPKKLYKGVKKWERKSFGMQIDLFLE